MTKPKYIIVHESRLDNFIDLFSGLAIIIVGWLLCISAIIWFGVAVGTIMVLTRVFQPENTYTAYSIEDARRVLDMLDEDDQEDEG